jgi:hypothetical protein
MEWDHHHTYDIVFYNIVSVNGLHRSRDKEICTVL